MRVIFIPTTFILLFALNAEAETVDKIPTQDNWKEFYPHVCERGIASKFKSVIFPRDQKTQYGKPFIIDEGNIIKPKKVNPDGSTTKPYLKKKSIGEIGRKDKIIALPQRIAFLNEKDELVTEDGEQVSENNPVKRYSLESSMLNFVGSGEELIQPSKRKAPDPHPYIDEEMLVRSSKNCSYLQTHRQFFTTSSKWRKFHAHYVCNKSSSKGFLLAVTTREFTRTKQVEVQPSMLLIKDHQGAFTKGPLSSLEKKVTTHGEECDWEEVKIQNNNSLLQALTHRQNNFPHHPSFRQGRHSVGEVV